MKTSTGGGESRINHVPHLSGHEKIPCFRAVLKCNGSKVCSESEYSIQSFERGRANNELEREKNFVKRLDQRATESQNATQKTTLYSNSFYLLLIDSFADILFVSVQVLSPSSEEMEGMPKGRV